MKKTLSLYYQFQLPQQSIKNMKSFHVDNFLAKLSKSGMWTIEVDAVIDTGGLLFLFIWIGLQKKRRNFLFNSRIF